MPGTEEGIEAEISRLRDENARLKGELDGQKRLLRRVFDESPFGIGVVSLEEARYLAINQAYCEFVGRTREQIFAMDPYDFWMQSTHPDDIEAERRMLGQLASGECDSYEIVKRYLLPDGALRWARMGCTAERDERGRIRYVVLAVQDMSEEHAATDQRRELEEKLRQSQKLEAIGRLAGGVAHDFNNRLLVIIGYTELLRRGVYQDEELQAHADVVLASARRAAELTRQLLAYGRRQVLRPRPTDLNGLVDRMRRMLDRVLGESVELITVLGAKEPMLADPGQVEQVLMNLVLNARDAMPGGGRITIRTADTSVAAGPGVPEAQPRDYVELVVEDTGPGIPEGMRRQIFEPFFTTKEGGKGTGLGLSMVEGIVRQSGGEVAVHESDAGGASFRVLLPTSSEAVDEAPAAPIVPAAKLADIETLLVVDDEDDVRRLLVDVLSIGAYQVLEARDGEHALEVVEKHPGHIELVVTDVVMPKLSGPDLVDRLRQKTPDLSVVYMSGYADRVRLRALRPDEHFLTKPFLPGDLFRLVHQILSVRASAAEQRAG